MAELGRSGNAEHIELGPLSPGSTERVASAILGEAPRPELIAHVQALSDGNPLYAEELLGAWARLGPEAPLPPKLRDLLAARLAQVPRHVLEVLRVAAAAGRRVDDRLLMRASGLSAERVQQAVRVAVDDYILIRSEGPERPGYRFRHEILRSVVAAQLLPAEAQAIHAAYARALEEEPPERRSPAELAAHWDAAGDVERALAAHVAAGHAVAATFAFEQASHHFERALELWPRVPDPTTLVAATREELVVVAAAAAARAGAFGRATEHMKMLIDHRGALPDDAWQLARSSLRWYMWEAGDLEAALEQAELVIAEDGTPDRWQANALGHAAGLLLYLQRTAEAAERARAARALAEAAQAEEERILAEGLLGWCELLEGEIDIGLAGIRRAVDDARATEGADTDGRYPAGSALAHSQLATALELVGRLEETHETAVAGVVVAARQGVSRTFGSVLEASAARAQYQLGHWGAAAARVDRALESGAVGSGRILLLALRGSLEVGRGHQQEAAATITLAESLIGEPTALDVRRWLTVAAVERALWQGEASEALGRLAFVVGDGETPGMATPGARPTMLDASIPVLLALGARAWADLALRERISGEEPGLSALARAQLEESLGRAAARKALADAWAADLALARAELARGEDFPVAERVERWRTAHTALAGRPYPHAYAGWRLAESLLARRDGRDAAAPLLAQALEVATVLGAGPLLAELTGLARRARLDLAPDARQGAGDGDAGRAFGLTEREAEVLALLARGLSNQEIAEQLFISPKTASVHVSNIYGKLGVESRVAAATLAHQMGLDQPAEEPGA
jgi:DNA-binding CsgD family transcriptional regulator